MKQIRETESSFIIEDNKNIYAIIEKWTTPNAKEAAELFSKAFDYQAGIIALGKCFKQHNYNSTASEDERSKFIADVHQVWNSHFVPLFDISI